ncbi:MAG: MoaD/ThiS family protein [Chloroflexi bacterium]|nr:MoaD/ThiS family protein [Chloroflexota bacterium]NWF78218.1 MoaD/ThiS family protein [Chloroflexota bacterium]
MKVLAKFVGSPYKIVGVSDIWLFFDKDEITVRELLNKLEMERGVKFTLESDNIVILVNGRRIEFMGGLDARLKDLDEIVVASIIGGG